MLACFEILETSASEKGANTADTPGYVHVHGMQEQAFKGEGLRIFVQATYSC